MANKNQDNQNEFENETGGVECLRESEYDYIHELKTKCNSQIQQHAAVDVSATFMELEQLRDENERLRRKNKQMLEYGTRKIVNFKFPKAENISQTQQRDVTDETLTEAEVLREENRIWRQRNKQMYEYGVKILLNLK